MARKARKLTKKYRKYLVPAGIAITILVIGLTAFALKSSPNKSGSTNTPTSPTGSANPNGSSYSTTPLNPGEVNTSNDSRKTSSNPQSTLDNSTPSTSKLQVTLTGVSVVGNSVNIHTLVNGASSGNCQVTASLAGQSNITASSTVVQNVNYYQCQDFGLTADNYGTLP
jgi:cytoskeletal protein RodZ